METKQKKKEYDIAYAKENQRQIKLNINRKTETDLLEWIEQQDNIQGYIKRLIMEDKEKERIKRSAGPIYDDIECKICMEFGRDDQLINCSNCEKKKGR